MATKASNIGDLNKLREDGVEIDKKIYSEQRSHILLVNGDHYSKANWKWLDNVRQNTTIDNDQKIRLTRNHMNRIHKTYVNKILSMAPDTHIDPQNEKELKDQKAAELAGMVWKNIKYRGKFKDRVHKFASSYCSIGEVFVEAQWDWDKGDFKRTEPILNEAGEQVGEQSLRSGELLWKEIFGFNVWRAKSAMSLDDSPFIGVDEMVATKDLEKYAKDDQKKNFIQPNGKSTYLVFDDSGYKESKDQVLVSKVYYRPCMEYPQGYFVMFTTGGVLEEAELPAGLFPIKYCLFDEVPTHPRGRSAFKQLKPYQVEINRVGSKMAEHQITLGDDKLVMSNGGKMQAGGQLNGVRGITVTGQAPMLIPGRTGEQYLGYADSIIKELYDVAMIAEELDVQGAAGQVDPYALLLTSSRWKTRFAINVEKFERFLVELSELSLDLYRHFVEEDTIIRDVGSGNRVNLVEFKNQDKMNYAINISPGSEDIETRVGKKLALDRYIQYAGANMQKEDLGKFLRLDPYLNKEQMFQDYTMDYDNAVNDILQMDRGETPVMNPYKYTDASYAVKKFSQRMGQGDFQFLPPQAQQAYQYVLNEYQAFLQQKVVNESALNAQFIPSGGAMVRADLWIQDPTKPDKQMRASFPYEALAWLKDRLDKQGMTQEALMQQREAVISDVAERFKNAVPPNEQTSPAAVYKARLQAGKGQ